LRESAIIGWAGMRGIVSLTVAIGLPIIIPGRNEVIFLTFVVILISLVIPGLTLPFLIRWLIPQSGQHVDEGPVREQLVNAALEKLHDLLHAQRIEQNEFEFLQSYFTTQHRVLENLHADQLNNFEKARLAVIQRQRQVLLKLWEQQVVDDRLLIHMENELDIIEIHIARGELN
jgi:monovalent cation/hydrogen antiporter